MESISELDVRYFYSHFFRLIVQIHILYPVPSRLVWCFGRFTEQKSQFWTVLIWFQVSYYNQYWISFISSYFYPWQKKILLSRTVSYLLYRDQRVQAWICMSNYKYLRPLHESKFSIYVSLQSLVFFQQIYFIHLRRKYHKLYNRQTTMLYSFLIEELNAAIAVRIYIFM